MLIGLKFATIERNSRGCVTEFHDGSSVAAVSHPGDPHYHVISHRCGYGGDVDAYCFEHEFAHEFLAEQLTDAPSVVLWRLAHGGEALPHIAAIEEIAVQTFQRWLRANEEPIVGGVDWRGLKAEALAMLTA